MQSDTATVQQILSSWRVQFFVKTLLGADVVEMCYVQRISTKTEY